MHETPDAVPLDVDKPRLAGGRVFGVPFLHLLVEDLLVAGVSIAKLLGWSFVDAVACHRGQQVHVAHGAGEPGEEADDEGGP